MILLFPLLSFTKSLVTYNRNLQVLPYNRSFKRDQFSCGKSPLDNYILRNVTKDVKVGACTCFVMIDENNRVIAYYTLASESVPLKDAPVDLKKQINYPHIPIILLGRLAVDNEFRGKGYGKFLLVDSLKRSLEVSKLQVGSVAVIVDPIDLEAEQFYFKYGFTKIPDSGRMFMSMRKIESAFNMS
ncbi:MAG: GNAT family N-acetyltransferase [Saprospiraceae bacterium]|nr:GNAT family N-acetyltransferase [Saprospiraceae bacterium]